MIALIVIDQQKGIDHPKLGERNNHGAEAVILNFLSHWRTIGWPIFHIKHRASEPTSVFWPEQDGYEFKDDFSPQVGEIIIEKSVPCAFVNNSLERDLGSIEVCEIAIVGVATNNSVEATARTGGNLGLIVNVVEDACFTFAKKDIFGNMHSAQEEHAMSLANLHGEYATVISSGRLLQKASVE